MIGLVDYVLFIMFITEAYVKKCCLRSSLVSNLIIFYSFFQPLILLKYQQLFYTQLVLAD